VLQSEATLESYFCFRIWLGGEYFEKFSDSSNNFYCIEEKILVSAVYFNQVSGEVSTLYEKNVGFA